MSLMAQFWLWLTLNNAVVLPEWNADAPFHQCHSVFEV